MDKYNGLERFVAFFLNSMPGIKKLVKNTYVFFNYTLFHSNKPLDLLIKPSKGLFSEFTLSPISENSFFGYYTSSPYSQKGLPIFHRCTENVDSVEIVCDDKVIDKTKAYNFQQGSLLQWLDENRFIYNSCMENRYISRVYDKSTKLFRDLKYPIYASYGNMALTLDFKRLSLLRNEYGYNCVDLRDYVFDDSSDGVFFVDILEDKSRLLFSFSMLASLHPDSRLENATHKVNHLQFAPDGSGFIFVHRWFDKRNVKYSRLYYYRFSTGNLTLLADDKMVSHCNFIDNKTVFGWMSHNNKYGYYAIDVENISYREINSEQLNEDGHPSMHPNGRYILTDTYPDRKGMQSIVIYDTVENEVMFLFSFLSPIKFRNELRCDLHPRWDNDGKGITFDSVHSGERSLYHLKFAGDE